VGRSSVRYQLASLQSGPIMRSREYRNRCTRLCKNRRRDWSASEIRARSPRPTNRALGLDERLEYVESGRSPTLTLKSKRAARERVGIAYRAHGLRKLRRHHLGGESVGQWERLMTDGHSDPGCGTSFSWRVRFRIDGSSCSSRFVSIQSGTTLSALRVGVARHPMGMFRLTHNSENARLDSTLAISAAPAEIHSPFAYVKGQK
jgi:hypothetical protein